MPTRARCVRIDPSSRGAIGRRETPVFRRAMATRRFRGHRALYTPLDCFASLAMTNLVRPKCNMPQRPNRPKTVKVGWKTPRNTDVLSGKLNRRRCPDSRAPPLKHCMRRIPVVLARRPKADVAIQESLARSRLPGVAWRAGSWIATSPIARLKTGVCRRPKAPRDDGSIRTHTPNVRGRARERSKRKSPPGRCGGL
jgi:hypothetical protein